MHDALDLSNEVLRVKEKIRVRFLKRFNRASRNQHRFDGLTSLRSLFDLRIVCVRLFEARVWVRRDGYRTVSRVKNNQVI